MSDNEKKGVLRGITSFEDLTVYQKARQFRVKIYRLAKDLPKPLPGIDAQGRAPRTGTSPVPTFGYLVIAVGTTLVVVRQGLAVTGNRGFLRKDTAGITTKKIL